MLPSHAAPLQELPHLDMVGSQGDTYTYSWLISALYFDHRRTFMCVLKSESTVISPYHMEMGLGDRVCLSPTLHTYDCQNIKRVTDSYPKVSW